MALDRAGNVFVTGTSASNTNGPLFATVAYSNGGVPLWTNCFHSPLILFDDEAQAIALDRSGAVYVTGTSWNNGFGYTTIKYSNSGAPVWTNLFKASDSPLNPIKNFITVGRNGTVFVAGTVIRQTSEEDFATYAYSSDGIPLWTNYYNGIGNDADKPAAIAVDRHDNVFVTGPSYSIPNITGTGLDFATVAYTSTGTPLWTNRFDGPGHRDDVPTAIVVDNQGDVFVGGSVALTMDGSPSYATLAYSSSGIPLWTNIYEGSGLDGQVAAMAIDARGNVFATGYSVANGTGTDFATIEYSRAGQPLSTNRYNGPVNDADVPKAIAVGPNGEVYVTGASSGTNGPAFVTIKYSLAKFH
jgi:hypothetical protein